MASDSVISILKARADAQSRGKQFPDDARLCLAVEGGGMRGIVSAGMLIALFDLGLLDVFDSYVGVSAGALNLAYTLAGQGALGISVYFEDMTDKEIVDLLRFRSEVHPMVDMRALYVRTVEDKRIDVVVLKKKYASSLYLAVTNVTTNEGELFSLKEVGDQFEEFLTAGALLPFVSGEPWMLNGSEYFDGGLHYIDPVEAAFELNSTHILVLNTQPQDEPIEPYGRIMEFTAKRLDREYPLAGIRAYSEKFDDIPYGAVDFDGVNLYRHGLPHSSGVGRLTMDTDKLVDALKAGYQSILEVFEVEGHVGILPTLTKKK